MKRFVAGVLVSVLSGLVYVYTEVQAVSTGYTIRKMDERLMQSLDRQRALKYNIARLKAPDTLEKRLLAQNIKLAAPRQWQTLVVRGPGHAASLAAAQSVPMQRAPLLSRFFVGTAQAEAKES